MNISPILLLTIGSTFAILYGLIITVGWAITRRNRQRYHNAIGYSEVELIDLNNFNTLGIKVRTVSLENNHFISKNENCINLKNFDCYIVEIPASQYPEINKGDLILIDRSTNKIKYAFKIPDLKNYR